MKPMVICKGLSDKAAEAVARELGVEVVELPQYYVLLELEDLEHVVRRAVREALEELEPLPFNVKLSREEVEALRSIAESESWDEAERRFGGGLGGYVSRLRSKRVLGEARSYEGVRRQALRALAYVSLDRRLRRVERALRELLAVLRSKAN